MLSDGIFPRYASETMEVGQTYRMLREHSYLGRLGDTFVILDIVRVEDPSRTRITLVVLSSGLGVQQLGFPKYGATDYRLLSLMAALA